MLKRFMKSGIAFVIAVLLIITPYSYAFADTLTNETQVQQATTEAAPTEASNIQKLAESKATYLTSFYGATSVQYAMIEDGKITLSGQAGVYNREDGTKPTKDHMYGIGSISKVYTTVAVMQLVEEGKLQLDTPVVEYLPEFTMADSRYKDITVRMLINHSSGLLGTFMTNAALFADNDTYNHDLFLASLKNVRLKADPGAFSVYSNDGFTLAEILVEKISGMSFTDYIRNNITTPLNLTSTATPQDDFDRKKLAKTYLTGSKEALPYEAFNMIGAGGIYSTAEDMCQFATIFMKDRTIDLLNDTSVMAMENSEYLNGLWPKSDNALISYGLGWDSVNTYPFNQYKIKALVKGGDTMLYHATLVVLPEENMAMAVLSSGGASPYDQALAQEVLLAALKEKGRINEIKPNKTYTAPTKAEMPEEMMNYSGLYANYVSLNKLNVSADGTLTLSSAISPEAGSEKFIYAGDGKFYYQDGSAYLQFVKESNDNTYLYVYGYSTLPGLSQFIDSGYMAQKVEIKPLSTEQKAIWNKRFGMKYFIANEKYTSQIYAIGSPGMEIPFVKDMDGFYMNAAIIDNATANVLVEIPGVYGRDLRDYSFFTVDDTEYMSFGCYVAVPESSVKSLSAKASFTCKINSEGFAHWYKIGKKSAGKTIKVTLPEKASFATYDENGTCIDYSILSGKTTVTLPKKGYIVFIGEPKAVFKVKYVK
ncbi:beta-lactamase family protein [Lachnospiraceae bacterium MD1]|uniref:Beta-lactamase family protein n=1 Tax=Variimorphobacter saccharofermentans TaxID=2755051 RepID=A0A839JYC4_9FIRM|nr:serine hydrolase domain-containing protein [Variimorphobacter saccharofermentans]MBB2181481.1 beta-lactamase family protein [Variimorphobacter saccharofermentans]